MPRKQEFFRKSGGLGAFIKNDIYSLFEVIETQTDYLFWLKLPRKYTDIDDDILIGDVYVPPMQSRFYNDDSYELFENDISDMCNKTPHLFLFGDFNAQTAEMPDYSVCDEYLADIFDYDAYTMQYFDQKYVMETFGITIDRKSQDKKTNSQGYKLAELCKNNNLAVLNGRTGKDSGIGKMTFRNMSVIDYIVATLNGH